MDEFLWPNGSSWFMNLHDAPPPRTQEIEDLDVHIDVYGGLLLHQCLAPFHILLGGMEGDGSDFQ